MAAQVSPLQRAQNFAQMTRQYLQSLPAQSGTELSTVSFKLPNTRLLSKIRLLVEATVNVVHAANASYTPAAFAPYTLLRRVSVDLNNGFSPFIVSGRELYMYNQLALQSAAFASATSGRGKVVQGLTASAGAGTDNTVRFVADLPITLNDRDPIGLILLQNQETNLTVNVDIDQASKIVTGAGYTVTLKSLSITPMIETFSIPAHPDAMPDLSVLKLVQSKNEAISGAGPFTLKLNTGTNYRKIILFIEDAAGAGLADSAISGDVELIFNQADTPYRLKPSVLAALNHEAYGRTLPQGMYVFDFSNQGIPNYGGNRDLVDAERLTEFWFRFNAPAAGKITAVYEMISRLKQA